jgi:gamma-tubulin complex component 2
VHTCFLFANSTTGLSRGLEINDPDFSATERPANMNKQQWARFQSEKHRRGDATASTSTSKRDETPLEKMQGVSRKYGFNFDRYLQILLDALNHYAATETVVLLGLCVRLSTANQGTESSGVSRTHEEAIL